jgi:hypothetical protein
VLAAAGIWRNNKRGEHAAIYARARAAARNTLKASEHASTQVKGASAPIRSKNLLSVMSAFYINEKKYSFVVLF